MGQAVGFRGDMLTSGLARGGGLTDIRSLWYLAREKSRSLAHLAQFQRPAADKVQHHLEGGVAFRSLRLIDTRD